MTTKALTDAVKKAFKEIMTKYQFQLESQEETNNMWSNMEEIMVQHLSKVKKSRAKTATVPGEEKEKKESNYYAYFHSCCNLKTPKDAGPLNSGRTFAYNPDLPADMAAKSKAKQVDIQNLINEDDETLTSFSELQASNLTEIVAFLAEHPNKKISGLNLLTRTSIVWWLFLTQQDRDDFKAWRSPATHSASAKTAQSTPKTNPSVTQLTTKTTTVGKTTKVVPHAPVHKPENVEDDTGEEADANIETHEDEDVVQVHEPVTKTVSRAVHHVSHTVQPQKVLNRK